MNYRSISKVLGYLLVLEAFLMLPSFFIALVYKETYKFAFLIPILLCIVLGFIMILLGKNNSKIKSKEGLAVVSFGWIFLSVFGALPFIFSKSIPSFVDAFFESISGFTTTGSTLITDVEILPKSILFWRSFTHWIGGMGILVFTIAFIPNLGFGGFQMYKAESPGPSAAKITPRIKDTAKILYLIYMGITLIQVLLLYLGGMSLFESFVNSFATTGTGGFSTRNASIGHYESSYIHIVITLFMVLSGISFSLYYSLFKGRWKNLIRNGELKLYLGIIILSGLLIGLNIFFKTDSYKNIGLAFRDSYFQTASIMTTTGYSTVDFDLWPAFSKWILFILMFIGGSAGSTSGGIKVIRILVLFKIVKSQIRKTLHPNAYIPVKLDGKVLDNNMIMGISSFFIFFIFLFSIGVLFVSFEGYDFITSASTVVTCLGNVGPGFALVGPAQNFSFFSPFTKAFLSFLMLMGRLELFTMAALLSPKTWKYEV